MNGELVLEILDMLDDIVRNKTKQEVKVIKETTRLVLVEVNLDKKSSRRFKRKKFCCIL